MAKAKMAEASVSTTISINGTSYDLRKAMPLTVGDWEDLDSKGVLEGDTIRQTVTASIDLVLQLVKKISPEITRDEVRNISIVDMREVAAAVQAVIAEEADKVDRPT